MPKSVLFGVQLYAQLRVTYTGSGRFWKIYPNGPQLSSRQARQLGAFEKMFRAKKKSTLKFK